VNGQVGGDDGVHKTDVPEERGRVTEFLARQGVATAAKIAGLDHVTYRLAERWNRRLRKEGRFTPARLAAALRDNWDANPVRDHP